MCCKGTWRFQSRQGRCGRCRHAPDRVAHAPHRGCRCILPTTAAPDVAVPGGWLGGRGSLLQHGERCCEGRTGGMRLGSQHVRHGAVGRSSLGACLGRLAGVLGGRPAVVPLGAQAVSPCLQLGGCVSRQARRLERTRLEPRAAECGGRGRSAGGRVAAPQRPRHGRADGREWHRRSGAGGRGARPARPATRRGRPRKSPVGRRGKRGYSSHCKCSPEVLGMVRPFPPARLARSPKVLRTRRALSAHPALCTRATSRCRGEKSPMGHRFQKPALCCRGIGE